jgi:predicted Zn-dependent peptidase
MIINLKSPTDLSGFYIVYYGSCNLEKPGTYGMSHAGEHIYCQAFEHMQNDLDSSGINWNAYTAPNYIVYHFTGLEENLAPFRDKLTKAIASFKVSPERFETEMKIIYQEYLDSFNSQDWSHALNLWRRKFNYYGPIGLGSDIKSITYDKFMEFYNLQYSHPDKIINVSKDFVYENVKGLKFRNKKDIQKFSEYADPYNYPVKENPKAKIEKLADFQSKCSVIYYTDLIKDVQDVSKISFLNLMLCMGLNSPLYRLLREQKQIAYSMRLDLDRMGYIGVNAYSTVTTKKNLKALELGLKEVLNNPSKYMTQERFDLVNNLLKINLKKRDINRYKNIEDHLEPKEWDVYQLVDNCKLSDLLAIYDKYFTFDKYTRSLDSEII